MVTWLAIEQGKNEIDGHHYVPRITKELSTLALRPWQFPNPPSSRSKCAKVLEEEDEEEEEKAEELVL